MVGIVARPEWRRDTSDIQERGETDQRKPLMQRIFYPFDQQFPAVSAFPSFWILGLAEATS